jgi:hypothetical protein
MVAQVGEAIASGNTIHGTIAPVSANTSFLQNTTAAVKIHDNVVIQPLGHALIIRSVIGPVSIVSNQFTCQGVDPGNSFSLLASTILIYNISISSTAGDIRNRTLNRAAMTLNVSAAGYNNITVAPPRPRLLPLPGKVLFTANQTTFAPVLPKLSYCSTAQLIIGRDDLSFLGNQSECLPLGSITKNVRLTHSFLVSVTTVRAMNNWFGEGAAVTSFSLVSMGSMNTTADNHSTHCILVNGARKVDRDNLVILNPEECKKISPQVLSILATQLPG